jgi:adenylosuccinate lyase
LKLYGAYAFLATCFIMTSMKNHELMAISPVDGRYAKITAPLQALFSEFSYLRARVEIEIDYLIALSQELMIMRPLTDKELGTLQALKENFCAEDAEQIKDLELSTRHDVKAIEYFLRNRLATTSLSDVVEWLHFGLTSEDINLTAQAIALREARDSITLPALDKILTQIADLVDGNKSSPMLARTHGQAAVPTTFGKEMAVFLARLMKQRKALSAHNFESKLNGAVGNFNALVTAIPQVDWQAFSKSFLDKLGLVSNAVTTQILPFDNWLGYFQMLHLTNSILMDLAQDMWRYISDDYLKLRVVEGEVGSSTMPQKVNPIDFENAEGNFGIANTLFEQFIRKLPISRLQRDLSDSTVRRTFGTAMGHMQIGYASLSRGLGRVESNEAKMMFDLETHWAVIAEGAQTILRAANIPSAYKQLEALTRGKEITQEAYLDWIDQLDVDPAVQSKLRTLCPLNYLGLSEQIAQQVLNAYLPNPHTR